MNSLTKSALLMLGLAIGQLSAQAADQIGRAHV